MTRNTVNPPNKKLTSATMAINRMLTEGAFTGAAACGIGSAGACSWGTAGGCIPGIGGILACGVTGNCHWPGAGCVAGAGGAAVLEIIRVYSLGPSGSPGARLCGGADRISNACVAPPALLGRRTSGTGAGD